MRLYIRESVLIPEGADDEGHQPTLLEPAHGKLRTQREEVTHLVQVQRTLARHRDESWEQQREGGKNDRKVKTGLPPLLRAECTRARCHTSQSKPNTTFVKLFN